MVPRLTLGQTALLVVDVQEHLLAAIDQADALVRQVARAIDAAKTLAIPLLVTEQYPKGLGRTVAPLRERLSPDTTVHEKLRFSAATEPVRANLAELGARCVIVCGVEAHVCVLQTCLDLLDAGFVTALCLDATASRRPSDREAAILRATQAGVLPTTVESALLELLGEAAGPAFKALLPLIK